MKVAIIGAGDVGATSAQRIAEADLADLVLVDIIPGKAEAKALDLSSASSIIQHSRSIKGVSDYKEISGAQIVVVTCGQTRKPEQTREDLMQNNAKVIKGVCGKIARYCPGSIVIVVTNPLDAMTYLAYKATGFPAHQIIGMGGVSDCARFNMLLGAELNTTSQNIQSIIIGPHSDNMLILLRLSTAGGTAIVDLLPKDKIENIMEETRHFGAKIVGLLGKGSAYFGPSAGVFLLVDSIINDRKNILCASTYLSGQYGLKDLCIGAPVKVGRKGIEEVIELQLNQEEKRNFLSSAKTLRNQFEKLGE